MSRPSRPACDITAKDVGADVQGDPQAALSAARTLVDQGASCLIGPAITPESIAIANGLTIRKKVTIWPVGTSMRLRTIKDEGTIFRTVPPDSLQALALAAAIADKLGSAEGKLVSIVYRNEPYGELLSKGFATAWAGQGRQGPGTGGLRPGPGDLRFRGRPGRRQQSRRLSDHRLPRYLRQARAPPWCGPASSTPSKAFVADALAFSTVPSNIPPQAIAGTRGTRGGTPTGTDAYKLFDSLWQKAGGVEHYSLDANSFDSTTLCFLAAAAGKSADPAAITSHIRDVTSPGAPNYYLTNLADALKAVTAGQKIDYIGVAGAFEFADNGDPTVSLFDIFEYQQGKLVVLKQIDAE